VAGKKKFIKGLLKGKGRTLGTFPETWGNWGEIPSNFKNLNPWELKP